MNPESVGEAAFRAWADERVKYTSLKVTAWEDLSVPERDAWQTAGVAAYLWCRGRDERVQHFIRTGDVLVDRK